jgi:hypothetical protein
MTVDSSEMPHVGAVMLTDLSATSSGHGPAALEAGIYISVNGVYLESLPSLALLEVRGASRVVDFDGELVRRMMTGYGSEEFLNMRMGFDGGLGPHLLEVEDSDIAGRYMLVVDVHSGIEHPAHVEAWGLCISERPHRPSPTAALATCRFASPCGQAAGIVAPRGR